VGDVFFVMVFSSGEDLPVGHRENTATDGQVAG
jgi:hypothetical protein